MYGGEDAFAIVDRKKMYNWLLTLKQKDGGFLMHHGGEEDARYYYKRDLLTVGLRILHWR
jgi:protein farnesyltransferase subunit beta